MEAERIDQLLFRQLETILLRLDAIVYSHRLSMKIFEIFTFYLKMVTCMQVHIVCPKYVQLYNISAAVIQVVMCEEKYPIFKHIGICKCYLQNKPQMKYCKYILGLFNEVGYILKLNEIIITHQ